MFSISRRSTDSMNQINDVPGPGYYEVNNNMKKTKKYNITMHQNKVTYKRIPGINGLLITSNGPICFTEHLSQSRFPTVNKTKKTNTFFGSSEIRFKYQNNQNKDLGPGYYDTDVKKVQYKRNLIIPPNTSFSSNDILCKIKNNFQKDSVPPIGSYHIERYNTIQGDLEKSKENKVPFGILSKRFNYKVNQNTFVGPGSYLSQFTPKKHLNYKIIPFLTLSPRPFELKNQSVQKNPTEIRLSSEIGPGKYKTESFFDWNKKSFNIKY